MNNPEIIMNGKIPDVFKNYLKTIPNNYYGQVNKITEKTQCKVKKVGSFNRF